MSAPAVSVVVPTYARPERLAACLAALAALEAPPGGLEVVVVDDGSPVPAENAAAPFYGRMDLRVLRQANAGPAAARNAGAAVARGALLAFTDDDCAPAAGWATALARAHAQHPDALLGGRTVNALASNAFAEASQLLVGYLTDYFGVTGRVPFVASNNVAVPADAFLALGGFDEAFPLAAGEDRDLCARWHDDGRPVVLAPEAVVRHAHDLGPGSFWRQHLSYGRGAYHYHQRRASAPVPEPLSFYGGLLGYPLRQDVRRAWAPAALHVALLGVAQVANVAGYAAERMSPRRSRP